MKLRMGSPWSRLHEANATEKPPRLGVALTKQMIQGQAVDARCRVMTSRALRRDQFLPWWAQLPSACLVAMEASPSAHHRARQLQAMGLDAHILSAQLAAPNRMHGHNVHATGMGPR